MKGQPSSQPNFIYHSQRQNNLKTSFNHYLLIGPHNKNLDNGAPNYKQPYQQPYDPHAQVKANYIQEQYSQPQKESQKPYQKEVQNDIYRDYQSLAAQQNNYITQSQKKIGSEAKRPNDRYLGDRIQKNNPMSVHQSNQINKPVWHYYMQNHDSQEVANKLSLEPKLIKKRDLIINFDTSNKQYGGFEEKRYENKPERMDYIIQNFEKIGTQVRRGLQEQQDDDWLSQLQRKGYRTKRDKDKDKAIFYRVFMKKQQDRKKKMLSLFQDENWFQRQY